MKSPIEFPQVIVIAAAPSPQALALPSTSCSAPIVPNENIGSTCRDANTKHNTFDDIGSDCDSDADDTISETDSSTSTIEDVGRDEIDSDSDNTSTDSEDVGDKSYYGHEFGNNNKKTIAKIDITCSSDCCNCNNTRVQQKRVSFGPIHVRQYERIVGDHPETKVGVPLAIGWAYYEDEKHPRGVSIERYESDRIRNRWGHNSGNNYYGANHNTRFNKNNHTRNNRRVRMTSITRRNMLLNVFGIPMEEIRRAEKETTRRQLRKSSSRNSGDQSISKAEAVCKKFSKTIRKRGMSFLKGMAYAAQIGMSGGSDSGSSGAAGLSV